MNELERLEAQLAEKLTGVRAEINRIKDLRNKARQAVTVYKNRVYRESDGSRVAYCGQMAQPLIVDGMSV